MPKTPKTPFTPEQNTIISSLRASAERNAPNLQVFSCAGSGKTTTAVAALVNASIPSSGIFSFAKRNAEDLRTKIPSEAQIDSATTHSAGLRALSRAISKRPGAPDSRKTYKISREVLGDLEIPSISKIISLAKAFAYVPSGAPCAPGAGAVSKDSFLDSLSPYDIDFGTDLPYEHALSAIDEILLRSIKASFQGSIDFDDMIYIPAIFGYRILHSSGKPFSLLGIDEYQDLTYSQMLLFQNARADRYFFVGDPGQAIYGFRGADYASIEKISSIFATETLRLSVSFRCPKNVVACAQPYYPNISAHSSNPDGIVETIERFDPSILKNGDMVLCRNNAPIVRLALKLISSGIPAKVLGRDISGVIRTMVKKAAKGNPNVPMKSILDAIENEIASKRAAASLKKDESRLQSLEDRWECLIAVSETLPTTATAKDLTDKLDNIFSDDKAPITLSTIHKAKGLEWDRVFILDFSLIGRRATSPEAKQQENNLAYVAITRAKRELRFISSTTERTV